MKTKLRKYKNRPAQTYFEEIGWVRDTEINNLTIQKELERIKKREIDQIKRREDKK